MTAALPHPDAALSETLRQDPADLGRHPVEEAAAPPPKRLLPTLICAA